MMAYRGEDLDLRTPQTWGASSTEASGGADPYSAGSRGGRGRAAQPILVDDTVLACSNHAFDVAVAHRAGEVRIEHLLHAMTRIESASATLEGRGIRVAGLRRESATIIASEIPIGLGSGQGRPRRADDFEAVLRTASAIAYRRNGPANIDDVLDALLDMPSDVPGIALLARHGGRIVRDRARTRERETQRDREPLRDRDGMRDRDPPRERERDVLRETMPLPPLGRPGPGYGSDVRLPEIPDVQRERSPKTTGTYFATEAARPVRTDHLIGTATDGIQNARIDHLENAVRTLTSELSNERTIVSGVVHELQRTLKVERDDTSRFRGGLHDRLQSLEQSVLTASNDDQRSQMHAQLHDRMKSLEYAVLNSRKDDGDVTVLLDRLASVERGLEQRVNELARPWSVLSDRLQALEQTLLDTRSKGADLTGLERAIRETAVDGNRAAAGLGDRLKLLERSLDVVSAKSLDLTPIVNRLDIIEEAVLSPDAHQTSDKVSERLRGLEDTILGQRTLVEHANASLTGDIKTLAAAVAAQAANTERAQAFVSDRIQTVAAGFERQRTDVMGPLTERLNALTTTLDSRTQSILAPLVERMTSVAEGLDSRTQSAVAPLVDRINALTASMEHRTQSVMAPFVERMNGLAVAIDTRGAENQRVAQGFNERMALLETRLTESIQRTAEAQAAHAAELREVHDALIKLNTNQHTLAGSIDQWRLDGVGDISVIARQLETIEKTASKPQVLMEHLTTSMDNINRATVERYHRRNRFWYWLFGTDDWLTASWPSQVASIDAERQALQGTPAKSGSNGSATSIKPVQRA
jgi:hypothetical protein